MDVILMGNQSTSTEATEEWETKTLGDIVDRIVGGGTPSRNNKSFWGKELPWATVKDFATFNPVQTQECITFLGLRNSSSNLIPSGTLITSTRMALGKAVVYKVDVAINQDLKALFLKSSVSVKYLNQWFKFFGNEIDALGSGSTVKGISLAELRGLPFKAPPLSEQTNIANTLSDVDVLLDSLDRLIAKKRDLKQAAMQQLLTGQARLPGFSGEWEVQRLGDVLKICHGKSQREVATVDGPYPILATGGQIGRASRPLCDRPSVLIGRKGTINKPQYMDTPFWTVDTLFYSEMKGGNCAQFFFYLFCTIDWMQFNEASGVPSLNARTIENIEVDCPEPIEQIAIAAALSDIDIDLSALEVRRDKTHLVKQGMMQELITGRIRLV